MTQHSQQFKVNKYNSLFLHHFTKEDNFSDFPLLPCLHICNEKKSPKGANFLKSLTPSEKGWMDDLAFYILFNSILVIAGRWSDDNERMCALGPCL